MSAEHRCTKCNVLLDRKNAHCNYEHCPWCQACVRKRHEEAKG